MVAWRAAKLVAAAAAGSASKIKAFVAALMLVPLPDRAAPQPQPAGQALRLPMERCWLRRAQP